MVCEEMSSSLALLERGRAPGRRAGRAPGRGRVWRSWGGASPGNESKLRARPWAPALSILLAAVSVLLSPGGGVRRSADFPFFPFGRQGPRDLQCLVASRRHSRVNRFD